MELIKKNEACKMLCISMNTLEKLIRDGELPAYRVSEKATRIAREDVDAYLAAKRIRKPEPVIQPRKRRVCEYYPGMEVV